MQIWGGGGTSSPVLAAHWPRGQRMLILWLASLIRTKWQEPEQSSRCLCAKFEQGFYLHLERISKRWGLDRNWMIQLFQSAKWFKSRNERVLWRSSNLENGRYAPRSNKKSAETVFCSHSSSSALPRAKQGRCFLESTKFSGLAGSKKQAKTWPQNLVRKEASFYQNPSNSARGTGQGIVTPLPFTITKLGSWKRLSSSIQVIRTVSQKSVLSEKKLPQTSWFYSW